MLRFALACIHKKNRKQPPKPQEKRKPPEFTEDDEVIYTEPTDTDLLEEFILRNPVHRESKSTIQMAMSGVNTSRIYRLNRGMMHKEGGWPKDVAPTNPESVMRFKKKIEKSECYRNEVVDKAYDIEPCLVQNNTMNIYEHYFENLEPPPVFETPEHKTINVYRDVRPQHRRVNHFSWSPDRGSKLAVSHCDIEFLRIYTNRRLTYSESFIWDVEKPNTPMIRLGGPHPMMCLEFGVKDWNVLISGMTSGQVALWDSRIPKGPTMINERSIGHRDCVNSVLWVNSKTYTEFFSGSNDGQVIWWDTRTLKEPLHVLFMDPHRTDEQILGRSLTVSKLEYETTIPTRFMCATHQGYIFSCNKKGKVPTEVINHKLQCHVGPVKALVRNAFYVKSFLTVGDWSGRIWVEECREHCVLSLGEKKTMVTDGAWSTTKPSVVFISSEDGVLQCYDILKKLNEPMLNIKVHIFEIFFFIDFHAAYNI